MPCYIIGMTKQFIKDAIGWGSGLWLIGYLLGIVLFMLVPANLIGWLLTPFATLITLWVLFKKVKGDTLRYYIMVALVWLAMAVVLDYLFLVSLLKPKDGYYKLDVYLYYALTLMLPMAVGWLKTRRGSKRLEELNNLNIRWQHAENC